MKKFLSFILSIWQAIYAALCGYVGGQFLLGAVLLLADTSAPVKVSVFYLFCASMMYLSGTVSFKSFKEVKPYQTLVSFLLAIASGLATTLKGFGSITNWNIAVGEIATVWAIVYGVYVTCLLNDKKAEFGRETAIALLATAVGKINYGDLSKVFVGIKPFNVVLKFFFKKALKAILSTIDNFRALKKKVRHAWHSRPSQYVPEVVWVEVANLTTEIFARPLQNYNHNAPTTRQPHRRCGCPFYHKNIISFLLL